MPTFTTLPALDSLTLWMRIFEVVTPALVYMTVRTLRLRRFHMPLTRDTYIPYVLVSALWMLAVRSLHAPNSPYVEFLGGASADFSDKLYVLTCYVVVPGAFAWLKTSGDLRGSNNPFDDGWEAFFREHANGALFVRMTLKNGITFAGFMGEGSQYSSGSKTVYFSEVCLQDADGTMSRQEGTAGFIVACTDILHIQFVNPPSEFHDVKSRKTKAQDWIRQRWQQIRRKYLG